MKSLLHILLYFLCAAGYSQIVEAEYFIDTDPGVGNATSLTLTGESIDESYTIPTTGLSEGTHKLYIRVLNSDGNWSLYDQNLFYINPAQVNTSTIVAAEYFIDTDPGFGNGTALSISGTEINQDLTLIDNLSDGFHNMYIRTQNAGGMWSLYEKNLIYVYQNNIALITAAEYFFDIDPGLGNGTSIDFGDIENLDQDFAVQVPSDLPEGDHYLYLRVLNTDGVWSLYSISEMLNSLAVEDEVVNQFKCYPNPVKDMLYLETNNQDIKDFKIIDTNGRVVFEKLPKNFRIDLSILNSGTYLLHITTATRSISKKLIKL